MRFGIFMAIVVVGVLISIPTFGAHWNNPPVPVSAPEKAGLFRGVVHTTEWGIHPGEDKAGSHVPGEVIARFSEGAIDLKGRLEGMPARCIEDENIQRLADHFGFNLIRQLFPDLPEAGTTKISRTGRAFRFPDLKQIYVIRFPVHVDVWSVVDSLRTLPRCVYAEPNWLGTLSAVNPNDGYYRAGKQWNLGRIDMASAWIATKGEPDVIIDVLDTGIDYRHVEYGGVYGAGCKIVGGWDYVSHNGDFIDDAPSSHGTMMAGIIGAITNNSTGIAGITGGWYPLTQGCSLRASKINSQFGVPVASAAANAILGAVNGGDTQVLNMSWSVASSAPVRDALAVANEAELICVAGKGNDGTDELVFPADYRSDWVIAVGGSNEAAGDDESRFHTGDGYLKTSNYGNGIDVIAPGVNIWSTTRTDTTVYPGHYDMFDAGTSMSTAHVSGLAALILSVNPALCSEDLEGIICASCKDITTDYDAEPGEDMIGFDQWSGWGRIGANVALQYADTAGTAEIHHFTHGGGEVVSSTGLLLMEFPEEPFPYNVLWVKQYEVQAEVTYPIQFDHFVHVWGRGIGASVGWSPNNPNYQQGYCRLLPETKSATGCTFKTYVYEAWDYTQTEYLGWGPCEPEDVVFAYSVLAERCSSVGRESPVSWLKGVSLGVSPNPSSGGADIMLNMQEAANLKVNVYSIGGRLVRHLYSGTLCPGEHLIEWDGKDVSGVKAGPGVYLCEVIAEGHRMVKKQVLLR